MIVACQAPLSLGFSWQEYWSGLPFPLGDLPNPGFEPMSPASPALAGAFFTTEPPGNPFSSLYDLSLIFLPEVNAVSVFSLCSNTPDSVSPFRDVSLGVSVLAVYHLDYRSYGLLLALSQNLPLLLIWEFPVFSFGLGSVVSWIFSPFF